VHKIAGIDACGYASYLASRDGACRRGDYYLGREGQQAEAPGTWHGRGAEELGLEREVSRDTLLKTWEGKDPGTGEIVVRRSASGDHVAAVDCTFSAPKSVSVTWALADEPTRTAIEAVQDRAVITAIDHIEATVPLLRRRVDGEIRHEVAGGLVAARFRHHTSRLSAEQQARGEAPDPQLHDHVAIANMALRDPSARSTSGRWAAIDSRELYRVAAEAGAVYRAELAGGLQALGYPVLREGRYVELAGISAHVREAFSARAVEVEAAVAGFVAEHGRRPRDDELKDLVVRSRHAKAAESGPAFSQWQARARAAGVDPRDFARPPGAPARPLEPALALAQVIAELTGPASPYALTRTSATFDTRQLRIAVAEAAQGRLPGSQVEPLIAVVQASPQLVQLTECHWTTQPMLDAEREVVAAVARRAARRDGALPCPLVDRAVTQARVPLSAGQQAAVRTLSGPEGIGLLVAPAGAGKGEVLRVVAEAHREAGYRVIALAVAGDTAQRLAGETEADVGATVDSFVHRVTTGRLVVGQSDLVVVDEAGVVETWRWQALLRSTGAARLIAAGDSRQLSPIEAGGLWPLLERQVPTTELTENYRARQPWARDAWAALRQGRGLTALEEFERRGQIVISDTRLEARRAAVDHWDRDRREGAREGRGAEHYLLLTDSSNAEVDALNRAAQRRRLAAGELGFATLAVTTPEAEGRRGRLEDLHTGDLVHFTRAVYLDGDARRVENGSRGVLVGVDPERRTADVRLPNREVSLDEANLDALRLGYAQHVYAAQGRTVERAYVVTGGWQTDRETSYVGISRARDASYVFADLSSLDAEPGEREAAMAELASRVGISRAKSAALATDAGDRVAESATAETTALSARERWEALKSTYRDQRLRREADPRTPRREDLVAQRIEEERLRWYEHDCERKR